MDQESWNLRKVLNLRQIRENPHQFYKDLSMYDGNSEIWENPTWDDLGNGVKYVGCLDEIRIVEVPDDMEGEYAVHDGTYAVCNGVFNGREKLTKISLPEGLRVIGENAFAGCTGLRTIEIPSMVEYIDKGAFEGCDFKSFTLPRELRYISLDGLPKADEYSSDSPSYQVTGGCLMRGNQLLRYVGEGTEVAVPDDVVLVGKESFAGNETVERITLPGTVTVMDRNAFRGCTSLQSVNMPDGLVKICKGAFEDCKSLQGISIPDTVTQMGEEVFAGCESLENVKLPGSMKAIPARMFMDCKSLKGISIPGSVERILEFAFSRSGLTRIDIHASVTEIGGKAFLGCGRLLTINIPHLENVKMGDKAFDGCPGPVGV